MPQLTLYVMRWIDQQKKKIDSKNGTDLKFWSIKTTKIKQTKPSPSKQNTDLKKKKKKITLSLYNKHQSLYQTDHKRKELDNKFPNST